MARKGYHLTDSVHKSRNSLPLELVREIDRLCDEFEQAMRSGAQPRIEDYHKIVAENGQDALLQELILAELKFRQDNGISADKEEYRKRFSGHEQLVDDVFIKPAPQQVSANAGLSTRAMGYIAGQLLDSADFILDCPTSDQGEENSLPPIQIGRYTVRSRLGGGAFGDVYLAHDPDLDILVALKVPNAKHFCSSSTMESFLDEARMAVRLNHPGIVRVYNVSRELGTTVIALEYVDGQTLKEYTQSTCLLPDAIAKLISGVAEAVNYANENGLIHRDLKPDNILIRSDGRPVVTDFGLAIHEDVQHLRKGELAGSPAYMAPEQVRRETHRLDGRTDQWSLGVILYEILTGRRPFIGGTRTELYEEIKRHDPKPPRQIDPSVPSELERICLKCLSKRKSDRYPTGGDLAEDLRHWRETEIDRDDDESRPNEKVNQQLQVIPRGLQSFDEHDTEFFLELLPGPRDRDGLPDSIRFWKTRIEEQDADKTFSVGLIYGPSGCGKSSLVKAGLIPQLGKNVSAVYVEATPEDTEVRLLKGLRRHCPELPKDLSLPDVLKSLREGSWLARDKKVLIVLDQFEQWLHARQGESKSQLIDALRHCDGSRVQCIVMVRDDFWLAVSRFMRDLEIRLVEGQNSTLVDLFDLTHATKVLSAFGRAFNRLPDNLGDISPVQKDFLKQSVTGLAKDNKVICVRLALFAEMMKGSTWSPAALKDAGGTEGIGVTFLESTFSASTAPPEHRYHQNAARALLEALLPEFGAEIKGQMKARDELLEASGYANRPNDFDDLIEILNSEIRLITPTDPDGMEADDDSVSNIEAGQKYYQLTHDYLVTPLRSWLTRKQKETMRGRAQLRLVERAATWNAHPENRSLPALWEWGLILLLTRRVDRTQRDDCRKMMQQATRFHMSRFVVASVLLLLAAWWGYERNGRANALALVRTLESARTQDVPGIVNEIGRFRKWADPLLVDAQKQYPQSSRNYLHITMALLPVDPSQGDVIFEKLLQSEPSSFSVICDTLLAYADKAVIRENLQKELAKTNGDRDRRFRAGIALVRFPPNQNEQLWGDSVAFMAEQLVVDIATNPSYFDIWTDALKPAHDRLYPELSTIFNDANRPDGDRQTVATILANYETDDPEALVNLLLEATPRQYGILLPKLRAHDQTAKGILKSKLDFKQPRIHAHASVLLLQLNGDTESLREALSTVEVPAPFPDLCTYMEDRLSRVMANSEKLLSEFKANPNGAYRAALVRSLGGMSHEKLNQELKTNLVATFEDLFQNDPDAAVHSASEWALRSWGEVKRLAVLTEENVSDKPLDGRDWYITPSGHTMVIRGPAVSEMGPSQNEEERQSDEARIAVTINRRFAIATKEVNMEQYLRFNEDFEHKLNPRAPEQLCPINAILWVEAVEYCRWLCDQEDIPVEEWCYPPELKIEFGMKLPEDFLFRSGYRLPTEAEWEYFCRANTRTRFCSGDDTQLLTNYAWFLDNSHGQTWPVGSLKPNNFGVFDMHGSVKEWCHDFWNIQAKQQDAVDLSPIREDANNITRGGTYSSQIHDLRSANRRGNSPTDNPNFTVGFRVARTIRE